jgi:uncharacterized protein involved in exopolysaccharide biosynthesis
MKFLVRRGRIDPVVSPTQTVAPLLQNPIVSEEELNSAAELFRDEEVLREVVTRTGLAEKRSWVSRLRRDSAPEKAQRALYTLSNALDVQPIRKSQLITVSYRSPDPQLATAVLKSLGDVYLARQMQTQRPRGQSAFFEDQVRIARSELQQAQEEYEHFARSKGVVSAALERDLTLQKLSEAQASDFALQASQAEAQGRLQSLDEKLQQLPARRVSQVRNSDNPQLQEKLKSKLLELELHRTQLLTKFESSYRLVQEVDRQIAQTKTALETENLAPLRDEVTEDNPDFAWANSERVKASVELQALRGREAVARQQLAAYQARAQSLTSSATEQSTLEQKLKAAQDKYLLYMGKREEARIGDALDRTGILNVAVAQAPYEPALPATPWWITACLSFLSATVISTGTVFVADYCDPSLRTPSEVTALLNLPVLASLPATYRPQKLKAL